MKLIKKLGVPKIKALGLENMVNTMDDVNVYEIKSIKLITPLDKGSANEGKLNDKKEVNFQDGMLYGKVYTVQVTEYIGKKIDDVSLINWELTYRDIDSGKIINIPISAKGEKVNFTMSGLDTCGRYIYIRAYIKDKKNSAVIKVWKHNRFRYFDQIAFERELEMRILEPWRIDQSGTSLCGMACIFYLFAKKDPQGYKKFCLDLFRRGEAKFNDYTIKPSIEILERKVNKKNGLPIDTGNMAIVDFITLAGSRNSENPSYKGGGESFQAISWPPLMTKLSEKLLAYKEVVSKGVYNPIKSLVYSQQDITNKINDINKQIKNGYKLALMVDSDLINDVVDVDDLDYHWIVLEGEINGELQYFNSDGSIKYMVDFKVYSWGTNPLDRRPTIKDKKGNDVVNEEQGYLKEPISRQHFMNNFYGYIKMK